MHRKTLMAVFTGSCLFLLVGCGAGSPLRRQQPPPPFPPQTETAPEATSPPVSQRQTPRITAALTLSEQAKMLLDQRKTDQAIRVLEQAINLHPEQGEPYFYLAEAWLQKENYDQALEFNRLAALYFKTDAHWAHRTVSQKNRILRRQP